jgi:hypothetical protein
MRSKTIISILAFGLTFGFSAYFASFFLPEKVVEKNFSYNFNYNYDYNFKSAKNDSAILKFLRQDIQNGVERSSNYYNRGDESNTKSVLKEYIQRKSASVKIYCEASSSMDSAGFPKDFRTAWKKHMKAWRDYSVFLENASKQTNIDEDELFVKTEELNDEISATWQDVLAIGENYDERVAFEIH